MRRAASRSPVESREGVERVAGLASLVLRALDEEGGRGDVLSAAEREASARVRELEESAGEGFPRRRLVLGRCGARLHDVREARGTL